MSRHYQARGVIGAAVNAVEEGVIALLLGLMTLLTFANVILRYTAGTWFEPIIDGLFRGVSRLFHLIFGTAVVQEAPSTIIWSSEVVLMMFAWLVLFGIAYCFKVTAHLGVDAVTNMLAPRPHKIAALIAGVLCIAYGLLFLKGAYDYWAPFADLAPTAGRWFPLGFDPAVRSTSFFETDQIPMPDWLRFLEPLVNYDERYAKLPRLIPYTMLPIAAALMLFRIIQAVWRVWTNQSPSLIVSHEAEDAVAEAALLNKDR
jgi:C4-dicarboxylate transporter DctQ subunit